MIQHIFAHLRDQHRCRNYPLGAGKPPHLSLLVSDRMVHSMVKESIPAEKIFIPTVPKPLGSFPPKKLAHTHRHRDPNLVSFGVLTRGVARAEVKV